MLLNKIKSKFLYIIPILIYIYECVTTYGKLFRTVDINREVFFPLSIINGDVLYKDIFNIFGPFSYYFNAILYKFFGINLDTIQFAGILNTSIILIFTYLIANKFLSKYLSIAIVLFTLQCAFFTSLMSYICPYAYAIVYGYSSFLISAYLFLKYLDNNSHKELYLSLLFAGISITCKYEFILYPIVIFIFLFFRNKTNNTEKKACFDLKVILCFLTFPLILFSLPFFQGLTLSEFTEYLNLLNQYSTSPSLMALYSNNSLSIVKILISIISLILLALIGQLYVLSYTKYKKLKPFVFTILIASFIFNLILIYPLNIILIRYTFLLIPILTLIMLIATKAKLDTKEIFIIIAALVVAMKMFLSFEILTTYANYFVGVIFTIFCILSLKISNKNKNILANYLTITLLLIATVLFIRLEQVKKKINIPFKTPNGTIYLHNEVYDYYNSTIKYIEEKTAQNDKIIVLPEGTMINFLTNRPSDNYYNIFTPDRVEAYGETKILEHYKKTKPEYFIISDDPQISYSKYEFCSYSSKICAWIEQNYTKVIKTDSQPSLEIYKRNDINCPRKIRDKEQSDVNEFFE